MPEMVPVSFFDNPEALTPPISVFDFHPFLAKLLVLSLLFLGQLAVLRLLMWNFAIFMYLVNSLVPQVSLDPYLRVDGQVSLLENPNVRLTALRLDLAVQDGAILFIFNYLNLDNMFFL